MEFLPLPPWVVLAPIRQLDYIILRSVRSRICNLMCDRLLDPISVRKESIVVIAIVRAVGATEYRGQDTAEGGKKGGHAAPHNRNVTLDDTVCGYHDVAVLYTSVRLSSRSK